MKRSPFGKLCDTYQALNIALKKLEEIEESDPEDKDIVIHSNILKLRVSLREVNNKIGRLKKVQLKLNKSKTINI